MLAIAALVVWTFFLWAIAGVVTIAYGGSSLEDDPRISEPTPTSEWVTLAAIAIVWLVVPLIVWRVRARRRA